MSHVLLIRGDARRVPLANGSVQCCVTSPPYHGLRDYGATGQLGLERLHDCNGAFTGQSCGECYICHMRAVFAECWRVLRDDGVMFVVIGDSYASSRQRVHAPAYGTDGTAPQDCQETDSSCHDLCDGCQDAMWRHRQDMMPHRASSVSGDATTHDSVLLDLQAASSADAPLDVQASTTLQSSPQRQGVCSHCANCGACLAVLRSTLRLSQLCVRRNASLSSFHSGVVGTQALPVASCSIPDTAEIGDSLGNHISDRVYGSFSYQYSTIERHQSKPLKTKDLCGIPQRLALALQADGWYWRSVITWCKTAPMPESVRDRPARATEQILLLSKSTSYFYDADAVRQKGGNGWHGSSFTSSYDVATKPGLGQQPRTERLGHNLWDYWVLGPEPTSFGHYATMPTALVERCIRAGTPQAGCCPQCRAPYVRQVEHGESSWVARKAAGHDPRGYHVGDAIAHFAGNPCVAHLAPAGASTGGLGWVATRRTTGFAPTCSCITDALADGCRDPHHMDWLATPVPSMVLDPFAGAGTVPLVARALGRHGVGMDLSWPYLQLSRDRLGLTALDAWLSGEKTPTVAYNDLPLFAKEPTP